MFGELWSDLRHRMRSLTRRAAVERELDAELRFHLEREIEKLERSGVPRGEAERRARLAFGGVDRTKEASRDTRGTARLETLLRDMRYAARVLRSRPTFTLSVVLVLGIGIGANSAVFTLVDALLLRMLPVPHAEQLVTVGDPAEVHSAWTGSPVTDYTSYPVFADIRDHNTVFSGVYANGYPNDWDVAVDADANAIEHPLGRLVSGGFFSVLQVPAYLGRTFTAAEDATPLGDPVAVISYDYWQRRFAGDRAVLGRVIHINRTPIAIIGVTAPGFTGDIVGESTDIWVPMMMAPAVRAGPPVLDNRQASWLVLMGRLRPGITVAQARSQITAIETQSIRAHVDGRVLAELNEDLRSTPILVQSGASGFSSIREFYGSAILIAMAAVGLVVLVVCANVCTLMLTRAAARGREMTVRMALGAGRGRLVQQLLTESAMLAGLAGLVAIGVAAAGSRLLIATATLGDSPIAIDTRPDIRVFAFTAAVTFAAVLLCGLAPAIRATRTDVATALRAQGRNLFGTRGRFGAGRVLVAAQMALTMLLLVGGGLLVRSVQGLLHIDLGLDRDHVVMVHVAAARTTYAGARLAALRTDFAARAREIPGVDAASYTLEGIFSGGASAGHVDVPGFVAQADSERQIQYDAVGPAFFKSIGATLVRGRDFSASDAVAGAKTAAINETMANAYFRGRDPIGRTVTLDSVTYTIAAVVRDVAEIRDLRAKPIRRLYFATIPPSDRPQGFELTVHAAGASAASLVGPIRRVLSSIDPNVPFTVTPLSVRVRRSVGEELLLTKMTLFFGTLALALAALGLYGVTAYSTAQRTAEFGLRTALGAEPGTVTRLVVGEAARVAIIGIVVGVPLGLLATRVIRGVMYGVGPFDWPSLSIAVAVLVCTSLVASWLPARRAGRVSPIEALRTE
jgi:putative ABC transport system permease protein